MEISMAKPSFVIFQHFQTFFKKCSAASSPESARVHAHSSRSELSAHQMAHAKLAPHSSSDETNTWQHQRSEALPETAPLHRKGASHLGCARSFWANPFSVKRYGLQGAISRFENSLTIFSVHADNWCSSLTKSWVCHCSLTNPCRGDVLIRAWEKKFLDAEGQDSEEEAAQAEELFRAAEQRSQVEEPESPVRRRARARTKGRRLERQWGTVARGSRSARKRSTRWRRDSARQADGPLRRGKTASD